MRAHRIATSVTLSQREMAGPRVGHRRGRAVRACWAIVQPQREYGDLPRPAGTRGARLPDRSTPATNLVWSMIVEGPMNERIDEAMAALAGGCTVELTQAEPDAAGRSLPMVAYGLRIYAVDRRHDRHGHAPVSVSTVDLGAALDLVEYGAVVVLV